MPVVGSKEYCDKSADNTMVAKRAQKLMDDYKDKIEDLEIVKKEAEKYSKKQEVNCKARFYINRRVPKNVSKIERNLTCGERFDREDRDDRDEYRGGKKSRRRKSRKSRRKSRKSRRK
jgi:hypothetical protein